MEEEKNLENIIESSFYKFCEQYIRVGTSIYKLIKEATEGNMQLKRWDEKTLRYDLTKEILSNRFNLKDVIKKVGSFDGFCNEPDNTDNHQQHIPRSTQQHGCDPDRRFRAGGDCYGIEQRLGELDTR